MSVALDRPQWDVAFVLNYYAPYVSGLTQIARVVGEGLARRGWRVVVVTSRHDRSLPRSERVGGVDVIRCPVVARVGKGVVSPSFPFVAARVCSRVRVASLHLPMLEAGPIATRLRRTPSVATYACDVSLPPGALNRLSIRALDASARACIRRSARVVVLSQDYAGSSRLAADLRGAVAIPPPCLDRSGGSPRFRDGGGFHVGFLGRIVEEKGIEYLVDGFRRLNDPAMRLLIAGEYERVAGGSVIDRVRSRAAGDRRIRLLGFLDDEAVGDFYASIDAFVLPSVNPLEAFGIVQVEAMLCGVPAIATDLPGVRLPVTETGFGIVVPPRDPDALAEAIHAIADGPPDFVEGRRRARRSYGMDITIEAYADLFRILGAGPS